MFCKKGRHSVLRADLWSGRAYGEDYMGRRLGILLSARKGKSYGRKQMFCKKGRHSVLRVDLRSGRAYGESYMGRRLGILLSAREGKSCGEKTDVLQEGTAFCIANGPPVGTRLRRGLYGQVAEGLLSCSEGEVLWKQADHVKRRSGPSYGRIGCFSVITWKRNRLSLLGRALDLIMKIALLAGKPSGSAVQMCFFDMQLL